jgi:hypothetical protein
MDCLEYFSLMLRDRIETGDISTVEILEAIGELVIYAGNANSTALEEDCDHTSAQLEQAYLKRETELDRSKACRALRRWQRDRERRQSQL